VTAWTRAFEKLADNPEIISKLQAGILQVRSSRDVALEMLDIYYQVQVEANI